MTSTELLAAASSGSYVHVGVFNLSVTNLLIIVAMVIVFVLALLLPFPGAGDPDHADDQGGGDRR